MADAGETLLGLINDKMGAGYSRPAAEAAVFGEHRELVRAWHAGQGQEPPEPPEREEPPEANPGQALLQLADALVALHGMPRDRAVRVAMHQHPALARAHNLGITIPKAPVRPRLPASGALRRLRPGEQTIDGRPYLHLCSDEASGGGIFAIGH